MFLIYVNYIVISSNIGKFVLYADDTYIFVSGASETEAYEKAQLVLYAIYDYMYANQLHINVEKSCYMHFDVNILTKKDWFVLELIEHMITYSL